MGFLDVIGAAIATFAFGALWYMVLAKPWTEAAAIPTDAKGRPLNSGNPVPYIVSFVMILLVAGMMRHVFALSGIDTFGKGVVSGLGIGAFFISPWLILTNFYEDRPLNLSLINAGYATFGCAIMGACLILFA